MSDWQNGACCIVMLAKVNLVVTFRSSSVLVIVRVTRLASTVVSNVISSWCQTFLIVLDVLGAGNLL